MKSRQTRHCINTTAQKNVNIPVVAYSLNAESKLVDEMYTAVIQRHTIQLQYSLLNSSNKRACSDRFVNVTIVSSK